MWYLRQLHPSQKQLDSMARILQLIRMPGDRRSRQLPAEFASGCSGSFPPGQHRAATGLSIVHQRLPVAAEKRVLRPGRRIYLLQAGSGLAVEQMLLDVPASLD